jgi:thiamine biosynthesis lipoprotein
VKEEVFTHTIVAMGTIVTIQVSGLEADLQQPSHREETIERAFGWFRHIEDRCTRFNPLSESMQLTARIGVSVPVSPVLYECVAFALAVAEQSGGAFDPTIGFTMQERGFNREYISGQVVETNVAAGGEVSYRDIGLDPDRKAITLLRPLILDLGAVAKGLAIDLAARELRSFPSFAINAGGDLYLGGLNPEGSPWSIGIRHPRENDALIDTVVVSNRAVCTSGDYERPGIDQDGDYHIIDPRTGGSADAVASVTVVAQTAMLADALATAAFVLGPESGIQLLEHMGVDGLIVTPALDRYETRGMSVVYKPGAAAIL